jgi:hypothetical protein
MGRERRDYALGLTVVALIQINGPGRATTSRGDRADPQTRPGRNGARAEAQEAHDVGIEPVVRTEAAADQSGLVTTSCTYLEPTPLCLGLLQPSFRDPATTSSVLLLPPQPVSVPGETWFAGLGERIDGRRIRPEACGA